MPHLKSVEKVMAEQSTVSPPFSNSEAPDRLSQVSPVFQTKESDLLSNTSSGSRRGPIRMQTENYMRLLVRRNVISFFMKNIVIENSYIHFHIDQKFKLVPTAQCFLILRRFKDCSSIFPFIYTVQQQESNWSSTSILHSQSHRNFIKPYKHIPTRKHYAPDRSIDV